MFISREASGPQEISATTPGLATITIRKGLRPKAASCRNTREIYWKKSAILRMASARKQQTWENRPGQKTSEKDPPWPFSQRDPPQKDRGWWRRKVRERRGGNTWKACAEHLELAGAVSIAA